MRKWYPLFLVAVAFGASALVYPHLPDRVPIHWDLHGEANGYGPRWVAGWIMPVVLLGMWALLRALPKVDPRRESYARMQSTYDIMVNTVLTLLTFIHVVALAASSGAPIDMARVLPAGIGVALIVLGNVLPRARPNWWFGIRTPWTLTNDRVWERTHRVGGYVFVVAGILAVVAALMGGAHGLTAVGVIAAIGALCTVVYSYVAWRQETAK